MPRSVTEYRVFLATPSGLDQERRAFRETVQDYNEIDALDRGVVFTPVGWEDTLGGATRPQSLINAQLSRWDYFLLALWDRWGSPPSEDVDSRFSSGCEEEFHLASDCLSDASRSMRQIVVFFKAVDARQLSDPGDQLKKVLKFKKELESSKKHFYMNFDNATSFRRFLLKYLAQWVRDHEDGDPSADPPITPVPIIPSSEPPSPNEMLNQAERLAEDGDVIEAEEIFANEVSGGDLEALSRYASFLLRVGRLNQAEGMYRRIVESGLIDQEKRALDAYTNLGIILHARRDFDRAKEMYTKALEISEELDQTAQPTLYSNLALIEERRGHLERAAAFHRKALDVTEALGWASSGGFQFYSCFVSYSHEDESFARRLHDQLQGQGIRCWLDEHDLKPGDRILDVVNSAIRLHEKILLCCSKASLNSWWVREEIRKAQERERREARDIIIPVMIDRYLLDGWEDGLAADLRSRLAADFTGWEHDDAKFEEQFERVVKALRADQGVRENVLEPRS